MPFLEDNGNIGIFQSNGSAPISEDCVRLQSKDCTAHRWLAEHRAAMREVGSSTPARPTLRVFK